MSKNGQKKFGLEDVSVVVCTRNEEKRIKECLEAIKNNHPGEIIIVDGGSKDNTVKIARKYADKIIKSTHSHLSRDRQLGIDSSKKSVIAMIDADHRLESGDISSLLNDLEKYRLDLVQSQLISYKNESFWNAAEEQMWEINLNIPGGKKMIGTAPAVYKKFIFDYVRFDDHITNLIDDTDFIYRLSKYKKIKFGTGDTRIKQLHSTSFKSYIKKFIWYGRGDGQFCIKNKNRAGSMLFHLCIRYPVIYPVRAALQGKLKVVPYFIIQGWMRFYGLLIEIVKIYIGKIAYGKNNSHISHKINEKK
jgi:glycosyltransferase involved in cell wall biosynthesis